jgi:hypothetical protein
MPVSYSRIYDFSLVIASTLSLLGLTPAMGKIVKRVEKHILFIKSFFSLFSSFSFSFCR